MIKKFMLISRNMEGHIDLTYDEHGMLIAYECCSRQKVEVMTVILERLQGWVYIKDLFAWATKTDAMKANYELRPIDVDVSFDAFWHIWGSKLDRGLAEKGYSRFKPLDQYWILVNARDYKYHLKMMPWKTQLYAKTYFSEKRWQNDWVKEITTNPSPEKESK